jgi:hypothetical protein
MDKNLITVPLTELRTGDAEVLGSLYRLGGKQYKWVKNYGSTSLVADGCCLEVFSSVDGAQGKRVISPDTAGVTAVQEFPAGVPMTAIGPSGSDTGDHGWIQVKGYRKVSQMSSDDAYAIGSMAIATSVQPATQPWAVPTAASADSATAAYFYPRKIVTVALPSTQAGAATCASTIVDIQCV